MEGVSISPAKDCLLVFIDDTGNETFAGQPYFGLGGAIVRADEYEAVLKPQWGLLRKAITGSDALPLHASDLGRTKDPAHLSAASKFFSDNRFLRFGVGTSANALVPKEITKRQPVYEFVKKYVAEAAQRSICASVTLIFESSQRADATLMREFGILQISRDGHSLPVEHCLMPKSANEPGLEAADFIANATGSMIRRLAAKRRDFPADFCAIFHAVPDKFARFMFVESVVESGDNQHASGLELRTGIVPLVPGLAIRRHLPTSEK